MSTGSRSGRGRSFEVERFGRVEDEGLVVRR